jgi:hypothetical protein
MEKWKSKGQKLFHDTVRIYIRKEYKKIYYQFLCNNKDGNLQVLIDRYYWGGNTVPFTAGQIIDFIKSKYRI